MPHRMGARRAVVSSQPRPVSSSVSSSKSDWDRLLRGASPSPMAALAQNAKVEATSGLTARLLLWLKVGLAVLLLLFLLAVVRTLDWSLLSINGLLAMLEWAKTHPGRWHGHVCIVANSCFAANPRRVHVHADAHMHVHPWTHAYESSSCSCTCNTHTHTLTCAFVPMQGKRCRYALG
jgi:hypothetical protein